MPQGCIKRPFEKDVSNVHLKIELKACIKGPYQKTEMEGWSAKVMCYTLSRKYLKTLLASSTCYNAVGRSENVEGASPIDLFINDT